MSSPSDCNEFWGPAEIHFTVLGRPRPQGSLKFTRKGIIPNEKLEHWRSSITLVAHKAMNSKRLGRFEAAVAIDLEFYFERPKNQYRTGKYSHVLKDTAPAHMIQTPDLDKLVRAVLDSLTEVVFRDDAQVVAINAVKDYGPEAKMVCRVSTPVTSHQLKGGSDAVWKGQEEKEEEGR